MAGVDPAKPVHFLPIYRDLFARLDVRSVLELGVHKGGGLRFFASLAPGARIAGIDTNLGMLDPLPDGVEAILGNAADANLLARFSPDVVVDDASHRWQDQQASFAALWPRTRLAYIIEDLELCYQGDPSWAVGTNTMDWLRGLVDRLHLGAADFRSLTFHRGLVVIER